MLNRVLLANNNNKINDYLRLKFPKNEYQWIESDSCINYSFNDLHHFDVQGARKYSIYLKSQIEKGQPIMDKHNSGNDEWRKNFKALDEDMKRRWYGEEGEAIRKWVKENGGKID